MKKVMVKTELGITSISVSLIIGAPKDKVWNALKFVGEIDKFHPMVKKSYPISDKKSGLDTIRHCDLLPMGQMKEKVVEWKEGKSITLEVVGGKMLPPYLFMKGKVDLEELGEKTKVEFTFSYQLKYGLLGRLMNALLIKPQFRKAPPKYVSGLKAYVESQNN